MPNALRTPSFLTILLSSLACLMVLLPLGAATGPAPVPVTFGPNINLNAGGNELGQRQRETTVAVNPRDSLNIVEGHIDRANSGARIGYSYSVDGGQSWTFGGALPREVDGIGSTDPAVAADAAGNFYFAYTDIDAAFSRPDIVVARSTDGGRTFPFLAVVHRGASNSTLLDAPDKNWIAVDTWNGSRFKGTIYVAWASFICTLTGCDSRIAVSTSIDRGATWSPEVAISDPRNSDTTDVTAPVPVVGPDGTVYVFWMDHLFRSGPLNILFAKSMDGGRTWSAPAAVAAGLPSPGLILIQNGDPSYGTKPIIGILGNSNPAAAVAPDGTLFVAWTDVPNGSCHDVGDFYVPCTNTDVRMSSSRNGGRTWSAPRKVSDDTGVTDQFFPWIATHPNGLLSLSWDDKRLDPTNANYDVFYTNTFDGVAFLPNVRVTSETSITGNGQTPIQDYSALAASTDSVFPVWADVRTSQPDIYVAVGRLRP